MFSASDKEQIHERGSSLENVERQINNFKVGFPPLKLEKPAIDGSGILVTSPEQQDELLRNFDSGISGKSIVKFVPASGAASRMFKSLFAFIDEYKGTDQEYEDFTNGKTHPDVYKFFKSIEAFALYNDLKSTFEDGVSLEEVHLRKQYVDILKALLTDKGLSYGTLPKGLLKFHQYDTGSRTPAEEHMVEGAQYAKDDQNIVRLHFTVSPEHRSKFSEHIDAVKSGYESTFGVTYEVSYSEQKPSTDTIAVDLENEPFRDNNGSILFRPAGHGALIANLDEIDADIIFIKNIDNVVPDHLKEDTIRYKKVIAGKMLEVQEKVFSYLRKIDKNWNDELETEVVEFAAKELNTIMPLDFSDMNSVEKRSTIHAKLNRPIRVSGMVSNVGDPGGGPFWARNSDGSISLQIVETAQIDLSDSGQKSIFDQSTHFNPVDLVCGVKNYQGEKFDLSQYVDPQTGFITKKSKDGKDLKAQELPGLWNGSMSDWISVFLEVPASTFNPVKQVNNLLEPAHQPG